jgi:hypothetical protein
MNALRLALSLCAGLTILAGCGGSQPPIGSPGAMLQSRAIATHAAHGKSWMLPQAKSEDLVYLSEYAGSGQSIYVYAYHSGRLIGMLSGFQGAQGLCVDRAGDVFVPELYGQDIVEYAHGSTKPKARLKDQGFAPNACDVDPTTGDLAVANYCGQSVSDCIGSNAGDLLIYPKARGAPESYHNKAVSTYLFCGYDSAGNLYADGGGSPGYPGFEFVGLRHGTKKLRTITLNQSISETGSVQWDGSHIVVGDSSYRVLYQFSISGSYGVKIGSTTLQDTSFEQFWITRSKVLSTSATYHKSWVQFFDYPAGGHYKRRFNAPRAYGITLSNAPSR